MLLVAACSRAPEEASRAGAPAGTDRVTTFSREAFAAPSASAGGDLPVPTTPDPRALDEILGAAPKMAAGREDDADGGRALLGTETGVATDAGAVHPVAADAAKSGQVRVGKVTIEPGMANPAIERTARAELYWPLVQRCRDHGGAILPPEVVHLVFHLDRDGYVIPATILAVPKEPRFADAARCMARELTVAAFRAPPGARGLPQNVVMDVPSVD